LQHLGNREIRHLETPAEKNMNELIDRSIWPPHHRRVDAILILTIILACVGVAFLAVNARDMAGVVIGGLRELVR
jgi:hypothetical protein